MAMGTDGGARALLAAENAGAAREAVRYLERLGCGWVPLGGKEGNFGLVNIGSDPALAFVERITNALDGVLERAAREAEPAVLAQLETPREAARELFGIPEGRLASLEDAQIDRLASAVSVTISDGVSASRPTLEVRDRGVGIAPEAMHSSILDLAGSNKLDKPYLAGAYGQGGSTTFGFTAGGSIVASSADGVRVGVTFVRFSALDPRKNKNGRYEYLVDPGGAILVADAGAAAFERGTLVRHLDYELPRHTGPLEAPAGLLGLVTAALFDPVLPIGLRERRARHEARDVAFAGAARRLGRAREHVELHQSLGIPLGRRGRGGLVKIRYWLLHARDESAQVRPDDRHVVYVSNFGQTHDVWPRSFAVDDLRMPFLKNALIVQVELDEITPVAKRELLSTTRDRLKRGKLFDVLHDSVRDALADERALVDANAERRRRLLDRQRAADQERLQRRFAELLETFRHGQFPVAGQNGRRGNAESETVSGASGAEASPLPTLEHPTFLRFARLDDSEDVDRPLTLPHGRAFRVALESDAPDGYVARYPAPRLLAAPDPPSAATFARSTDFRGGRARIVVRAEAEAGATGVLRVRLTVADGSVLVASHPFVVVEPPQPLPADDDGTRGVIVPKVYEVTRDRWRDYDFDEGSVALVNESPDDFSICVNVDNAHLVRLAESVSYQQTGITRMRSAFLVQAAFYAFLLHRAHATSAKAIDNDVLEGYERRELDRVAQTIVSSIAAVEKIDAAALASAE